jgi:outer membrane lipoprotein SlyB
METTTKRMHPLMAGAAASVILVSLVGAAAITGLLPSSHSTSAPTAAASPTVTTPAPAAALSAAPEPSAADLASQSASRAAAKAVDDKYAQAEEVPARAVESKPVHKAKPVTHHSTQVATAEPAVTRPVPTASPSYAPPPPPVAQAPACYDCGRVIAVNTVQSQPPSTSGVGAIGGAVVGGLLGNQVGGGNGRALATVAGALGGGFAGNEVEKRTRHTTTYQVKVRMEDGHVRSFPFNNAPSWGVGDRVRVVDGYLQPMGANS